MNAPASRRLSTDEPIRARTDDSFGRAPFAGLLADALAADMGLGSLVVGLEGAWGSGKTSLLNLIEESLAMVPAAKRPLLVHFNPWWFSRDEDLAYRFFEQAAEALGTDKRERIKKLAGLLRRLAIAMKPASLVVPAVGIAAEGAQAAAELLAGLGADLSRLKADLAKELLRDGRQLWILIDDVDRVSPPQSAQMTALVRGLGDLPLTRYVLAYDRGTFERLIAKAFSFEPPVAAGYLDKIVQVTFPVPEIASWCLGNLLEEGVASIAGPLSDELRLDLTQVWWGIFEPLLRTPRDVNRILNAYALAHAAIGAEVHPIDLLLTQAVRVFVPGLYPALATNKALLTGDYSRVWTSGDEQRAAAKGLIDAVPETQGPLAQRMLEWLFPGFGNLLSALTVGRPSGSQEAWSRERRIASSRVFDAYFRFEVPPESLSRAEIAELTECLSEPDRLAALLLAKHGEVVPTLGAPKSFLFGEEIMRRGNDLADESGALEPVVRAMLRVGDTITADGYHVPGGSLANWDFYLRLLINTALESIDPADCYGQLDGPLRDEPSVHCAASLAGWLIASAEEPRGPSRPLLEDDLAKLKQLMATRLETAASEGRLREVHPLTLSTLYAWRRIDEVAAQGFIDDLMTSPEGTLAFMAMTTGRTIVSTSNERGPVAFTENRLQIEVIERFVGLIRWQERLKDLASSTGDDSVRSQVDSYLAILPTPSAPSSADSGGAAE